MSNKEVGDKQIGDLQAALGQLWKSVDDFKLVSQSDSEKVLERLDTWIATNRVILESNQQLLTLIVQNSQEVQRSAKSYEHGSQLLVQLQQQMQQLASATTQLNETLDFWEQPSPTTSGKGGETMQSPLQSEHLSTLSSSLNQQLNDLQDLQALFSQSVETLLKNHLTHPRESSSPSNSLLNSPIPTHLKTNRQTPTWGDKVFSPLFSLPGTALIGAIAALLCIGIGMAIAQALHRLPSTPVVGEPTILSEQEMRLLRWAKSAEGELAYNIMEWNWKLSNLQCREEAARLGVTLDVNGELAESGFCTIWVVPPEQRQFR
jgi:hypothetical protein